MNRTTQNTERKKNATKNCISNEKTNKQEPKQTNGRIAFGCSPSIRNSIECCCCLMHQRTQNNNNRNLWLEFERFICTATEKTMLATTSITIRRVCVCLCVHINVLQYIRWICEKLRAPGLFPNNRFFNCLTSARQHRTSSSHHKWMNSQINFDLRSQKTEQVYFTDKLNGRSMDGVGMDTFWNANQEANEHQN